MRSSTSSSEASPYEAEFAGLPRRGRPWGLLLALLLVLGAEAAVRRMDVQVLSVYEVDRVQQHTAVRDQLELLGPADFCVIGDSRSMAGIDNAQVYGALRRELGPGVTFGNYACSAAMVEEQDHITQLMLDRPADELPRMILWGVMPIQVLDGDVNYERTAHFWLIDDWVAHQLEADEPLDDELHTVVQNHLGRVSWLHRFRLAAPTRLQERWLSVPSRPNAIVGEQNHRHAESPAFHADEAVIEEAAADYADKVRRRGLSDERMAHYDVIAERCRARGVTLVMYELPLPSATMRNYPMDVMQAFRDRVRAVAARHGASYYTLEDLGVRVPDEHFREHSHMNYLGARQLTAALLRVAVLPKLKRQAAAPLASRPARVRPQPAGQ